MRLCPTDYSSRAFFNTGNLVRCEVRLYRVISLMSLVLLPAFSFAADAVTVNHEALVSSVCYLTEVYLAAGHEAMVLEMKELRKGFSKKVVFSAIQLDGPGSGKVLYHPAPFVTGHNVSNSPDADGQFPGREALQKAKMVQQKHAIWLDYKIRHRVTGERETRFMYCERGGDRMVCGSYSGNGSKMPFTPAHAVPNCF